MNNDIVLIDLQRFVDDRGTFNNYPCPFMPQRVYTCYNHEHGLVRGYHFHSEEEKFFVCIRGTIKFAIAEVDNNILRTDTVKTHILSQELLKGLYIPKGYANAWQTLENDTILLCMSSLSLSQSVNDDKRFDPLITSNIWKVTWR